MTSDIWTLGLCGWIILTAIQNIDAACSARYQIITGHSACLSRSGNAQSYGVSASEKIEIVDRHNHHRSGVSPEARNMLKMAWDDEVALIAQAYAENCVFAHDGNQARMIPGRYTAGQNLAIASGSHSWTARIDSWHSEVDDFAFDSGSINGGDVGHYTQMVWAESHKIGCGYAYCTNLFGNTGGGLYVCNYSPGGNVSPNQNSPYSSGTSCQDCPSSCNSNLCDCSSYDCYNYGTMDVNTCSCSCRNNLDFYVGSSCALNCTEITSSCGFTQAQCSIYSNVPFDCPKLCGFCPAGDSTDLLPTTTPSAATALPWTSNTAVALTIAIQICILLFNWHCFTYSNKKSH